jgi:hypothetical protein
VVGQTCGILRVDGGGFENLLERVGLKGRAGAAPAASVMGHAS